MAKPEWGHKRTCPKCSTRFYDLQNDDPVVCIACGHEWVPEPILKSKQPIIAEEREDRPQESQSEVETEEEDLTLEEDDSDETVLDDVTLEDDDDNDVSGVIDAPVSDDDDK
ncbi:MAG: TIGR02300 family protein [Rhodothalassiaceae bacterium]